MAEDDVEGLRRDIGEKMARDGESLHANASESLKSGYRRGIMGFGSNMQPRLFGKGASVQSDWVCVCGQQNKRYLKQCYMCSVERKYSENR